MEWKDISEAKTDGTHYILAVKSGPFVYAIEGAYMDGKWMNAADISGDVLCFMENIRIPERFLPWEPGYKDRHCSEDK